MKCKKALILLVLLLVPLFAGCGIIENDYVLDMKYVAVFEDEIYDEVKFWYPISEEWEECDAWVGFEENLSYPLNYTEKVMFHKDDSTRLFLVYDNHISDAHYFYKRSEPLPQIYSDSVEKVVLSGNNGKGITLEGTALEQWKNYFESVFKKKNPYEKSEYNGSYDFGIYVYFKDLPYYRYYGILGINQFGELCVFPVDAEKATDYIVLPNSLAGLFEETSDFTKQIN